MAAHSSILAPGRSDKESDLASFRGEVIGPLSYVPFAASLYILFVAFDGNRLSTWLPIVTLAGLGLLVRWLRRYDDRLAAIGLIAGLDLALTLTAWVYPGVPVLCLYAPVVGMASVLLGPLAGLSTALVTSSMILYLQDRSPELTAGVATTAVFLVLATAVLAWLATRPVYTALEWAWYSYSDGLRKTEQLRERQVELGRLSKVLEETCIRLEQLNHAFLRAQLAAEEARRQKDEFVATVSHELRTPINLVIGYSELMALSPERSYDDPLPTSYRADIEAIYRNAGHISNLIDDILDLSQIDAHRMALVKDMVLPSAIVESAVTCVASLFRGKHLDLNVDVRSNLPAIYVDGTRIRQVLINLLTNAARFTDQGSVTIRARRQDRVLSFAVSDTGVGMTSDQLRLIFQPFHQVGDDASRQLGNGLGLAISKRFVELHGGSMWAESQPGGGTTFSFSIPIEGKGVILGNDAVIPDWLATRVANEEQVVLALDSEGDYAHLLQRYLDGYKVVRAQTAHQARHVVETEPVRAVILASVADQPDRVPPVADERLLDRLPSVVLPLEKGGSGAGELGVAGFLTKPVSAANLRSAFKRLGPRIASVLIVDDDPDMVRLLARMVRSIRRNSQIWEARDGRIALRLMRDRRPDVVLLDLLMPDLDGYGVLDAIKGDELLRSTPVIVVSARGREHESMRAASITFKRAGGFGVGEASRVVRAGLDALLTRPPGYTAPAPRATLPD